MPANTTYCSGSSPPATPLNAVAPGSVTYSIGDVNSFTCVNGYSCTTCNGSATAPHYMCLQNTQWSGQWSPVIGSCDRMLSKHFSAIIQMVIPDFLHVTKTATLYQKISAFSRFAIDAEIIIITTKFKANYQY